MKQTKPNNKQEKSKSPAASWHAHPCIKCGEGYSHEVTLAADHEQSAYQCPNERCEWFAGKGRPKSKPPTKDADGKPFVWPPAKTEKGIPNAKPSPYEGMSNKQKTVAIGFKIGDLDCANPDHYGLKAVPGEQFKKAFPRPSLEILRLMEPFVKASCPCERAACREAWEFNRSGVSQTEWVSRNCYYKGVGEVKMGQAPKKVFCLNYRLSKDQFEHLHTIFPDYHFVQVKNDGHDHPLSHAITAVVSYEMMSGLKTRKVMDFHGNPAANAQLKAELGMNITTFVGLITAKDYLRKATKWRGHDYMDVPYVRDMDQDAKVVSVMSNIDAITSTHTGYYYSPEEIVKMLSMCKTDTTLSMIMHKFDGEEGSFNMGELAWKRIGGDIQQTNVETGESYRHPDNSVWFNQDAWASTDLSLPLPDHAAQKAAMTSLAWTKTKVAPNTYRILVVLVPTGAAFLTLNGEMHSSTWKPTIVRVEIGSEVMEVAVKERHLQLLEDCKKAVLGKVRNEAQWKAHQGVVKSKVKVHEDKVQKMSNDEVDAIMVLSFWDGYESQVKDNLRFNQAAHTLVRHHTLSMSGHHLAKGMNWLAFGLQLAEVAHPTPEVKKAGMMFGMIRDKIAL